MKPGRATAKLVGTRKGKPRIAVTVPADVLEGAKPKRKARLWRAKHRNGKGCM